MRSLLVLLSASLLLTGCTVVGMYDTARTCGANQFQGGGSVTPAWLVVGDGVGAFFWPVPELSARYGVSENFDIGARLGPGFSLTGKYQMVNGKMDAALFGAVSAYALVIGSVLGGSGMVAFSPRLILSNEAANENPVSFNFGVDLYTAGYTYFNETETMTMLTAGIGFPRRVGKPQVVRIFPELCARVPLFGDEYGEDVQGAIISFGIGVDYAPLKKAK